MTSVAILRAKRRLAAFEPTLDEALSDPIVALVLRRDGLKVEDVRRSLEASRLQLLARSATAAIATLSRHRTGATARN